MKMTDIKEFSKELFIPLITAFVLLIVNNEEMGKLFMTIMIPVYIPSSFVGLCR